MQIAGDSFALGNFGKLLDLFVGLAQAVVHTVALGEESISRADENWEQRRVEQGPAVEVEQQAFDATDTSDGDQADDGGTLRLHAKGHHRGSEDEERTGALVDGLEKNSKQYQAGDVQQSARTLENEKSEIEAKKYDSAEAIEEPQLRGGMTQNRIDEKETEIDDPKQRTPAVVFILEKRAPRFQFPWAASCAHLVTTEGH